MDSNVTLAMRFATNDDNGLCKFYSSSSWTGIGENLITENLGSVQVIDNKFGFNAKENAYITIVYIAYHKDTDNELYDNYMRENEVDKLEYYVDGNLYGYTYYGSDSYKKGLETWNNDTCPFFVGACPWYGNGNIYYMQGELYTCRLYTKPLTNDQVLSNVKTTKIYRESLDIY